MKSPCVYLLASQRNGTLYVGVTSDLVGRMWQDRYAASGGFTARYRIYRLVWFETHDDMLQAIMREKAIKRWLRKWKIEMIETRNPEWIDLYPGLLRGWSTG